MTVIPQEELQKLHELTVQMALDFVSFCRENQLLCYLCGGGCIGTVRHKGWIPWDDDLDFFMPREDYEKAIRLWPKCRAGSRYVMERADEKHSDGNLFFVIRDRETTYIKPYQKDMDICHGIVLDVLPLDGFPKKKSQRRWQCFWALTYSLFRAQMVPQHHGKAVAFLGRAALTAVPSRKVRYKLWRFAEKRMTKYSIRDCDGITELCSGPVYMRNYYPKEAFREALFLPFEETELPVPVGYDGYLRIAFGDYMQLPPPEKQIPSHDVSFMDLYHSYEMYRGTEFLQKEKG